MSEMSAKLSILLPEIVLFVWTCVVMVIGLSPASWLRRQLAGITAVGLVVALGFAAASPEGPEQGVVGPFPYLLGYGKGLICVIGLMLLMLAGGTVDRAYERAIHEGNARFDPLRSSRGEFYAFFLFSLTGAMLCVSANDLIWLFLALELTSLPTYVMVTMSTRGTRSQESGVKYFFLGALGAAIFLYGFALLYGGTGSTLLVGNGSEPGIAEVIAEQVRTRGGINPIAMAGLVLAIVGVSFKIAAVPMHFYTADVYEGSASSVSAFLAFVPKLAGMVTIMLLVSLVGWGFGLDPLTREGGSLPAELRTTLWVMAALTMTVGNVLAVVQNSAKRMLAYSSVAHSGYMLVGVIAGPGTGDLKNNGLAAVLLYLAIYGITNVGAFGVLACLQKTDADGRVREAESVDDLRGLCKSHPALGWSMVLCSLGLLGMPPLLGFFGKVPLFTSALGAGEITLLIVLCVNSAIAAFYYLRLMSVCLLEDRPDWLPSLEVIKDTSRGWATLLSAGGVVVVAILGDQLLTSSERAARFAEAPAIVATEAATDVAAGGSGTTEALDASVAIERRPELR